jgi:hypothetical protein
VTMAELRVKRQKRFIGWIMVFLSVGIRQGNRDVLERRMSSCNGYEFCVRLRKGISAGL